MCSTKLNYTFHKSFDMNWNYVMYLQTKIKFSKFVINFKFLKHYYIKVIPDNLGYMDNF